MPLCIGDEMWFDGSVGEVVAVTDTLDANGRGSITYGSATFHFRALKESATPTPLVTSGVDAELRVGVLERQTASGETPDPRGWALVFDDPYWGRIVGGNKATWDEAASFAAQDSCVIVAGWTPGTLTLKDGGTLQASKYVDFALIYDTDDGEHEAWWQPAYPYAGWPLSPAGCWRTNLVGEVERVYPDGSTERPIFPRGMGARCHRSTDTWPSAPEPERTLEELRMYYQQEYVTVTEGDDAELDLGSCQLTINGPPNALYRCYWYDGYARGSGTLNGAGTATATGLPPGDYTVAVYHTSDRSKYLDRKSVSLDKPGDTGTVSFAGSWSTGSGGQLQGRVIAYGTVGAAGVTVWVRVTDMVSTWNMPVAVTDSGGYFGPVDWPSTSPGGVLELYTMVEDERYGAAICDTGGTLYWEPVLASRIALSNRGPIVGEGLIPWDDHENLPPPTQAGYFKGDLNGTEHEVTRTPNNMGAYSEPMPRWFFTSFASCTTPAAPIQYTLYDMDGTSTGAGCALLGDPAPGWVPSGSSFPYHLTVSNFVRAEVGGKIKGAAVEADRGAVIDSDGLREPHRLGLEFGSWERPLEHRHGSDELDDAAADRALTLDATECAYCGGQVWTEPSTAAQTRWFCADCKTQGAVNTDCRGYFRSRTLATVSGYRDTIARNDTTGVSAADRVEKWLRPEEYDEAAGYVESSWLGLGLDRWVAEHIVFGTWSNGALVDGESISDAETRLGRTIGACMLKLELTQNYTGTGYRGQVTATDPGGASRDLEFVVPPGARAGDWFPLDWQPHPDAPRGYYTDVTAMEMLSGDGALYCRIVNDGPALHDETGTVVTSQSDSLFATDASLGGSDPFLREDFAGRTHLVSIENGNVMHRTLEGTSESWSPPVNVTLGARWYRGCREPSIAPLPHSGLVVAATSDGETRLWRSEDDGERWE